jgi:excisionase family DNA binding protein
MEDATGRTPEPGAEFIGVEEIAAWLGVPRSWVYFQAASGRLPHVKIGKYVRFRADDMRAWVEAQRRGPAVGAPTRRGNGR